MAAVLIGGPAGSWAWYSVSWYRHFPVSWLLYLQGDDERATEELGRRYGLGMVSDEGAGRMFEQAVKVRLDAWEAYPAGIEPTAWLRCDMIGSLVSTLSQTHMCGVIIRESKALLDGVPVPSHVEPNHTLNPGTWVAVPLPVMKPGAHALEVIARCTVASRPYPPDDQVDALAIHTWDVRRSASVVVVERPVGDFVQSVIDDAITGQVESAISVPSTYHDEPDPIYIRVGRLSVPVVGRLEVRASGEGPYEFGDESCWYVNSFTVFQKFVERTDTIADKARCAPCWPAVRDARQIDIRSFLIPGLRSRTMSGPIMAA